MSERGTIDQQLHDTKSGVAILVTCLVQEISKTDSTFADRVMERFERAYREVKERDTPALDRLELINWVREMLTGWSPISGQGRKFLDD
ncbi:hypothetical protein [Mesorhizobium sp. B2-6-4]|uniref:hypothetical protein n=1 Tax=Mesorhizobium sp. B2-6-4 TaxID=2589913 RepID=UPI001125BD99|nr:hypothetical protein [Mesorhizobium sp. B2-6-4]TPJ52728.1 hypothetical protein FJ426_15875 [Mesorhizobium sp. B2-6-4]